VPHLMTNGEPCGLPDGHTWNHRSIEAVANNPRTRCAEIKLGLGCSDCGYRASADALEFDHRPGEPKQFGIAASGHRWTDVLAEMLKCDVVCANCHRIRTRRRRGLTEIPGQLSLF
jgi:hypothetical protein